MALYLGKNKVKINLNGIVYCLNLYSATSIANIGWLLSSDDYILQDSNGIYLIPRDSASAIVGENVLLSSDSYILKDSTGLYLIFKESE